MKQQRISQSIMLKVQPYMGLIVASLATVMINQNNSPLMQIILMSSLLLFMKQHTPMKGYLIACVVLIPTSMLVSFDSIPFLPPFETCLIIAIYTLYFLLVWLLESVVTRYFLPPNHLSSNNLSTNSPSTIAPPSALKYLLLSFIFPVIYVASEYFLISYDEMGSYGAIAYSIDINSSFGQLSSIIGIHGLSFLMAWFSSVIVIAVLHRRHFAKIKPMMVSFLILISLAYFAGSKQLNQVIHTQKFTTVASISHEIDLNFSTVESVKQATKTTLKNYLSSSKKMVEQGAQVISWAEGAIVLFESDKQDAINSISQFAAHHNVHIAATLFTLPRDSRKNKRLNQVFWFDPAGQVLGIYDKNHGQTFEQTAEGKGKIMVINTEYGKFGVNICWDMDFPKFMTQASEAQVDVLLNPSRDYPQVMKQRARIAAFRASENGFSLVRATSQGISIATDQQGRTLMVSPPNAQKVTEILMQVPTQFQPKTYRWVKDIFGVISSIIALMLFIVVIVGKVRSLIRKPH